MVPQTHQPMPNAFKSGVLATIINEQIFNGSTVVSGCNGTVTLLSFGIPDLRLDGFSFSLDRFCGEFYSNC
jgi:hypothetical protein